MTAAPSGPRARFAYALSMKGIPADPELIDALMAAAWPLAPSGNAAPAPSTTRAIQDEYCVLLGYVPSNWAEGEAAAAKAIAERWTVDQFRSAYQYYKSQPFWKGKRIMLRWLRSQMDEYFTTGVTPAPASEPQGYAGMREYLARRNGNNGTH